MARRVVCGMKPDGAIPHRPFLVRLGRGEREESVAWEREGGCGAGVCGENGCVGRRWKRGRPFPRAARSLHQPPQLAGSAAASPARPEKVLGLRLLPEGTNREQQ